ncbi:MULTISPECIES: HIT family protein [Pontibacillus]|uniref:Diadenosine tetraphosphate hydrolase n=1 Tax=Pontibacillus marinus BH030004 = DSM 16465 TaxID=1385511 RepID=A0A0A5FX85_9BACI|nr:MULTISPECIES: HIT domain-containing protein [Pontibacillus]KGX83365.1 diadenosine tetraphosphate hydrolase [Pontibacillus marinus BH030004 = DSM 16465]QHE50883.1 HIT domain-containing protein [Pontibacillus sp. HMF3514]QHE52755.1 HIT domain-containing protein [Pontibacillus sp. HMF3514]
MKLYSHKPEGYECPFCRIVSGIEKDNKGTKQRDIIYQNKYVTAFIASKWWPNNKGHVLVVPNEHFENIYELTAEMAAEIHRAAQMTAFAMKHTYGCDGVSTRQHNEPAGNQDVWHYHLHVYPRYENDNLYLTKGSYTEPDERPFYSEKLRLGIEELLANQE